MSSQNISANFGAVEAGAMDIKRQADGINNMLEEFHNAVVGFVNNSWKAGAATEAFQEMQKSWGQHASQLQTTLQGAADLVSKGNAELQGTDSALANLF
ncbi:WXG100 family type VII secretion target [Nocardia xishanensis]|uniref:WXG100 family type VII secretion target n=1 Tax=Nocardia xishanensis TaxID=238964 RepID=UPI00082FE730|nr:WXG100 family type VII secretion target [Nocardia xishanensis]